MKKSEFDFSIPRRQSKFAILQIIYKYYRIILRQIWPIALIVVFGGKAKSSLTYLLYMIIAVALISMVYAVLAYFKFYYYISDDELIIEKGLLQKNRLSIPIERIQTVNQEQNIIHRLCNIVKLEIDTAGSSKEEFALDALSLEEAAALKERVLSQKRTISDTGGTSLISEEIASDIPQEKTIHSVGLIQLLKIGLTENHLRSGGLIFVFFFWIYSQLQEAGLDDDVYEDYAPEMSLDIGWYGILVFIGLFFLVAFLVSMVRSFFRYFNLRLKRMDQGFNLEYGLFNRSMSSALDRKVQMVSWSSNFLQKRIDYRDIYIKQAASESINLKKSMKIPGCDPQQSDHIFSYFFPALDVENLRSDGVNKYYLYRRLIYISPVLIAMIIGAIFSGKLPLMVGSILMSSYIWSSLFLSYKKMRYTIDQDIIKINKGSFGDVESIIANYKIQAVKIKQTPFQRRKDLANLRLLTASGGVTIPYVELSLAERYRDYLLYKVEDSTKSWM